MLELQISGIKQIEAIAQSSNEYISLSQGALRIGGIPQEIKDFTKTMMNTDKTDYYQSGHGIMPLREKIASVLSIKNNTNLSAHQILVTHGCIGAISNLFLAILEKGDDVLIPEPTYPAYYKMAEISRCNTILVSTLKKENNEFSWQFDIEAIKKATTAKTKIIVFANPINPVGVVVGRKEILELADWCKKNKIYLIIDEAYKDYVFDNSFKSCVDLVNENEYVITLASFSKNMAMSGWRVGYMVANANVVELVGKVQDALLNCTNVPAQYAALYSLEHPELTIKFHDLVQNNCDLTIKLIQPLIDEKIFEYQKPNSTFFIFLKTQFEDSNDLCLNILNQAKVALIPGKYFGPSGKSFMRLCFARDTQVLQEGIDRLLKYFL